MRCTGGQTRTVSSGNRTVLSWALDSGVLARRRRLLPILAHRTANTMVYPLAKVTMVVAAQRRMHRWTRATRAHRQGSRNWTDCGSRMPVVGHKYS
jgi:hypothetical protein